jgi:NAD(P)-dependent dehydrogenase (short-subunit alcohol dehydrogenase family)
MSPVTVRHLINVSSALARVPAAPIRSIYSATKAAVVPPAGSPMRPTHSLSAPRVPGFGFVRRHS